MINEFKFHVVAFTVFLCLATSLTAQTNPAAKEVMGEIKLLIQTCLSEMAKSQDSFQQLLKHGYSERVKKRFIVYNKTLKVRQAVLSRPKVRVDFFRTKPERLCIFGFQYLALGAEQGMMEFFGQEAKKLGFRKVGVNPKINRYLTVAHEYYAKGPKKISVVLGLTHGYIHFSIDEVR
ncbi:hypothetical protein [Roseovarius aestuarii]|uniref:Uncharacterized protein n=1 Tax=Roseovarius aestuarii TaxID=475083 RepID=A0A1X7BUL8_9RHOB|nr:hypothetical protein [Roseovarius aestuarii]SMC13308.1 hypothetical protein ROA7745_03154 [Roseovarius aestuarii]